MIFSLGLLHFVGTAGSIAIHRFEQQNHYVLSVKRRKVWGSTQMFENSPYLATISALTSAYPETIYNVTPLLGAKQQSCSYCGKHRLPAYHIATHDGRIATSCYPCSDNGMNWLEQNFPKSAS